MQLSIYFRYGVGQSVTIINFVDKTQLKPGIKGVLTFSFKTLNHFLLSFGLPLTVLCHTIGKFVLEQKFCVTAIVLSKLRTTCQNPPGTKTVSPGCWISSICKKVIVVFGANKKLMGLKHLDHFALFLVDKLERVIFQSKTCVVL